ncbi:DNA-directed RNA polymerase subunit alpha [candidate division CSSED10-310 bacterium]|uniref:DNA-directed RNA polymerase subunit alpha n=1 Tax=candidate division CSSED10-310 bacterium TaxID=2855610 RepID=A0ABV6YZA6_UNCC1
MIKQSIKKPERFEFEENTLTKSYGKFWAEPFERGFATTIGNSLRRVMLSSIYGTAVTSVKIDGVLHEFSTIPGVIEDATDIILNIKQLHLRLHRDEPMKVLLHAEKEGKILAGDISTDADVEILNPDLHLATLDKNATLNIEMNVEWGIGYSPAEEHADEQNEIGVIYIDAPFSPVERVNFWVENTRVGRSTEYERLYLEIYTDGTISPQDTISKASTILKEHYSVFLDEGMIIKEKEELDTAVAIPFNENLLRRVDELELSVRSYNCLKKANIQTIAQLVQKTEQEMLATRNFGRKSLNEIKQIIGDMGLRFGMNLDEVPLPKEVKEIQPINED